MYLLKQKIKFILPLDVLDKHSVVNWIEISSIILTRPVPDVILQKIIYLSFSER